MMFLEEAAATTSQATYETWEIIFWYSAFVVTVVVFVVYIIFHNRRHKQMIHYQENIGKEITRLEGIKKNLDHKKKFKDIYNKTLISLQTLENNLYGLKEKTSLPDIDVELGLIDKLQEKLKHQPSDYAAALVYMDEVIAALGVINSTFVTIMGLIK